MRRSLAYQLIRLLYHALSCPHRPAPLRWCAFQPRKPLRLPPWERLVMVPVMVLSIPLYTWTARPYRVTPKATMSASMASEAAQNHAASYASTQATRTRISLRAESKPVQFRMHAQFKMQGEGGCEKRWWALLSVCILHV